LLTAVEKGFLMTTPVQKLHRLGQSLWYDNIQRRMLEDGTLANMIRAGELRGMTSNPSIFNQAIAKSSDYDDALKAMAWAGYSHAQILERLVIEDIRTAADLFLAIHRRSKGIDGYVSIEVDPTLAYDTDRTLAEAQRLWRLVNRPNLMVKIPATRQGIPAIRQAVAQGININITLIFSLDRYREVMEAYLSGLEQRLQSGEPLQGITSVASFFISRIDTKVDARLERIIANGQDDDQRASSLLGKVALANARLAYVHFREVFDSDRFARLKALGAQIQRPLWASTSTKNPAYPETMYVDELIGERTVNTVPPQTLEAFRKIGNPRLTIGKELDEADQVFERLRDVGISIEEVTDELEMEGVKAFSDAYAELLQTVQERREAAIRELGPLAESVVTRVAKLQEEQIPARMRAIDASLWTDDPAGRHEIRKRMGWLYLPDKSRKILPEISFFADEIRAAGYTHALLLGMGGSSLAPEVMSLMFGTNSGTSENRPPGLIMTVLDSTDPAQVRAAANMAQVQHTLFIVSSKSGMTAEVDALLAYFWDHAYQAVGNHAGDHFVAITDQGTPLEALAKERDFRQVFNADPKVGGRYSALTAFGLAPAALLGVDISRLLDSAARMARQCSADVPAGRNPGLVLGAVLGEAARQGRDKLTLIADDELLPFGPWLEQLIAESSGKDETGIVPVDMELLTEPSLYGPDRIFVYLKRSGKYLEQISRLQRAGYPVLTLPFTDDYDLGAEFYRWEVAVATACIVLGVNPFNQPNVQDSKTRTDARIKAYHETGKLSEGKPVWEGERLLIYGNLLPDPKSSLANILTDFLALGGVGDYVALNAYLPCNEHYRELLQRLRLAIRKRTGLATTVGFGPRFLHSTGQLHKGGANNGLFLQITAKPVQDLAIPGWGLTFGIVQRAQALGDLEALLAQERRAMRVHLPQPDALAQLVDLLEK
jgi:transaldolase / glucose-6-phosphate isomerase